jgi:hypothetical protein
MSRFGEAPTTSKVFFSRRPETSRNGLFGRVFSALFECCSASFCYSVRATALGSIIASHLVLICKRNPAETALAGFEHPRSAPQHSVEILSVGVGSVQHLSLKHSVDSTHENDHERLPLSMLTCPKNNIRFSLRFKEKRAARRKFIISVTSAQRHFVTRHSLALLLISSTSPSLPSPSPPCC